MIKVRLDTRGDIEYLYISHCDQIKAKEITGEDIEIDVGEIDTDVIVDVNINELARTEGIVSVTV